jgi:DNA-binding NarL/FixJ family response regulator
MRVVICDDSALFGRGLTLLLADVGVEVVAQARDTAQLHAALPACAPEAVILDIRMPPTFTDEGLTAAADLRRDYPHLGILVLSTYAETTYAIRLLEIGPGVGYLLKDRVDDATTLRDAIERVIRRETVVDPDIVNRLFARRREQNALDRLTERERHVLALMAEGRSNSAIAGTLYLGEKTIESHIASVMTKLDLEPTPENNRRVLAVLTWMRATDK